MKYIINKHLICESLHETAVNTAKYGGVIDANAVTEQALSNKGLNAKNNQEISEKKQLDDLRASKSGISTKDALAIKKAMKLQGHG